MNPADFLYLPSCGLHLCRRRIATRRGPLVHAVCPLPVPALAHELSRSEPPPFPARNGVSPAPPHRERALPSSAATAHQTELTRHPHSKPTTPSRMRTAARPVSAEPFRSPP